MEPAPPSQMEPPPPDGPRTSDNAPSSDDPSPASASNRPRLWTLWIPVLLAPSALLCVGFGVGIVAGVMLVAKGGNPADPVQVGEAVAELTAMPLTHLISLSLGSAALFALALFGAALSPIAWRDRLTLVRPAATSAALPFITVTLGAASAGVIFDSLVALTLDEVPPALQGMATAVSSASTASLIGLMVMIGVIGPIGEELLFRGYLQTRLVARLGPVIGIGATSLLFGLIHFNWLQIFFAAAIGAYLGWASWRLASILPSIAGHIANNVLYVALTASGSNIFTLSNVELAARLVVGGALLVGSMVVISRAVPSGAAQPAQV